MYKMNKLQREHIKLLIEAAYLTGVNNGLRNYNNDTIVVETFNRIINIITPPVIVDKIHKFVYVVEVRDEKLVINQSLPVNTIISDGEITIKIEECTKLSEGRYLIIPEEEGLKYNDDYINYKFYYD